jgi:hypothetical protein
MKQKKKEMSSSRSNENEGALIVFPMAHIT